MYSLWCLLINGEFKRSLGKSLLQQQQKKDFKKRINLARLILIIET